MLTMMHDKHNGHFPSTNATAHPSLRQLPSEAIEEARDAFKDGRSPKQVLELLQQRYNPAVTAQDVYNLKAKISRADSAKSTPAKINQRTDPDIPTDPALQMQDPSQSNSMLYPNQAAHTINSGQKNQLENGLNQPIGEADAHKCQCKCCDH